MRRINAYTTYLIVTAVSTFFLAIAFTTSAIYRFEMAQLTPLQLVLLGTMLEATIFLFEIPTGIVADLYSRRLSVIIGYTLIGCGLMLEGALPLFITILLAQAVWGIGYTFISGAFDAWLADELGEERLTAVYLRGTQVAQLAALLGIAINVALASIQLNIPLLVGGAGHILVALFLIIFMPETGFHPTPNAERNTWQKMGDTFREGVVVIRGRPLLMTIMGIALFYGLYSEALDRLWEAHILDNFTLPKIAELGTVVWFGLINATIMISTIFTTGFMRRRASKLTHHRTVITLAIFSSIIAGGLIIFGLAQGLLLALAAYGAVALSRKTMQPLYSAWVNRGIEPQVRATVLSTLGQMDAIGQAVGGPFIGVVATRFNLRAAIVLAGVVLSPVLALYARAYRQEPVKKDVR